VKVWIAVAVVGAGTIALKGLGPALLGARRLPERVAALVGLLAPTLLAALVVTQALGSSDGLSVDARLVGVGAAGVALALRAPLIVVVALAAAATAATRALA
jgi:branched-subunit amino acid transport protein